MIIPIFIPHGGCPERCKFCDQSVSGGTPVSVSKIRETIETYLENADSDSTNTSVAFYGGTFTALNSELQLRYLNVVREFALPIRIATRPDAIDPAWMRKLRDEYGLNYVEMGVQSHSGDVLASLGRTHRAEDVERAVFILKRLNLSVGLHLMIGNPNERADHDARLKDWVLALAPTSVRIHPLLVLKGTELERVYLENKFSPLDLETAVERAATLVAAFEEKGIRCIRIGLQPNELLETSVVAGPFHPAFGALVRSRIQRKRLENLPFSKGFWEVFVPENKISQTIGEKACNLRWLERRFELTHGAIVVVKAGSSNENIRIRKTSD